MVRVFLLFEPHLHARQVKQLEAKQQKLLEPLLPKFSDHHQKKLAGWVITFRHSENNRFHSIHPVCTNRYKHTQ